MHSADAAALVDDAEVKALRSLRSRVRDAWDTGAPEAAADRRTRYSESVLSIRGWRARTAPAWCSVGTGRACAAATSAGLAAFALLEELRAHGADRLGVCVAGPCRCVYVDASKNRTRRYCCAKCADRTNAAAYRARARGSRVSRVSRTRTSD